MGGEIRRFLRRIGKDISLGKNTDGLFDVSIISVPSAQWLVKYKYAEVVPNGYKLNQRGINIAIRTYRFGAKKWGR
jgi:hypothetical protein